MAETLIGLQEAQARFDREHEAAIPFFEPISDENIQALEHLVVCIAGEVGELANCVKKVRRGDLSLSASRDDLISEAADIFIYLLKLSNQLGFDLTEAYLKKASFNEARFSGYKK